MKYYIAARYSSNEEMRKHRNRIEKEIPGAKVTSRWIDQHGGQQLNSFVIDKLNEDVEYCWQFGQVDLDDIDEADTILSFTFHDGGGKGGRHVEFGYGIGKNKRMIVIGPRENIFHTDPRVTHFWTIDEFIEFESGYIQARKLLAL